jgi:hypothetical protein
MPQGRVASTGAGAYHAGRVSGGMLGGWVWTRLDTSVLVGRSGRTAGAVEQIGVALRVRGESCHAGHLGSW